VPHRLSAAQVLLPLAAGSAAGRALPAQVAALRPHLPRLGIASLLLLVAGGARLAYIYTCASLAMFGVEEG